MADARARAAVQQCHDSLADLQRSCKAAKAFQEAGEALLAAAADAVQALDALLAAAASDPARGRGLQQLAVRCQGALDQVRLARSDMVWQYGPRAVAARCALPR